MYPIPFLSTLAGLMLAHPRQLFAIEDPEDRVAKLAELNVKEQVLNVMKSKFEVRSDAAQRGAVVIVWWRRSALSPPPTHI